MKVEELYKVITKFQEEFLSFRHEMNAFRKETRNQLSKHSQTLMGIENTLSYYGDMYKVNKDAIDRLDNRIAVIESA